MSVCGMWKLKYLHTVQSSFKYSLADAIQKDGMLSTGVRELETRVTDCYGCITSPSQ